MGNAMKKIASDTPALVGHLPHEAASAPSSPRLAEEVEADLLQDLPPLEEIPALSPSDEWEVEADLLLDLPPLEEIPALSPSDECQGTCAVCFEECSVLQLGCEHTYCLACLEGQLAARWPGPRVTFQYLQCALCRAPLAHELIQEALEKHRELRSRVIAAAVRKFQDDDSSNEIGEDVNARAEAEMAVYMCSDCSDPYCAGRVDCAAAAAEAEVSIQHRCHECEWAAVATTDDRRCMRHGHRFAMFKCDSCCAVATWNCYSNHYCERCHNQASDVKCYPCPGPDLCPLGMPHPRNVQAVHGTVTTSFVIGCTACLGCTDATEENFGEQNVFGYQERDWLSFASGAEMLASIGEQEVRDRLADQGTAVGSALECADQLLLLEEGRAAAAWAAAEGEALAAEERARAAAEEEAEYACSDGGDWAREQAELAKACDDGAKEAAVAPPSPKVGREAKRALGRLRESMRRQRHATKLARLSSSGERLHHRGGRHKVPVVWWPDGRDSCSITR